MPYDEVYVQLATRIPKHVHRELKLHCVQADQTVMAFVIAALEAKLARGVPVRVVSTLALSTHLLLMPRGSARRRAAHGTV